MSHKTQQTGFSLIELMVAMVLGLIISGVAIQVFVSNKGTYRLENSLSRLQENGRYVVENMVRDLRMAGYNGCLSRGDSIVITEFNDAPLPFTIDGTDSIRGYNANTTTWTPAIDANLNLSGVAQGTDVLNIQRASSCGAHVAANHASADTDILVNAPNNCSFTQYQAVMITNCIAADIFQISNSVSVSGSTETLTRGTAVNSAGNLSAAYSTDAQVFRWQSNAYFIGTGANGEPALFRSSWSPDNDNDIDAADFGVVELADGVEDLQILYGEDTGGDQYADTYVTANAVTDWEDVRSIRINLLLRSEDLLTQVPRTIQFNGGTVNSGPGADRRLRMAYSTTVTLRNNLP